MTQPAAWLALLGPLALVAAAAFPGREAAGARAGTRIAADFTLALAIFCALVVSVAGPLQSGTLGFAGAGLAVRLDLLSVTLFVLVSFVGAVVVRYAGNYLDGDPRQQRFQRMLAVTLASVLLVILAGNLLQLALAWVATSLALHTLLVFYPERPAAVLAARKKFLVSRLGEACLVAALVLIHGAVGSLDLPDVMAAARSAAEGGSGAGALRAAALLLVATALLKSAQFPLHGWLLEVMETPTPVSALLHAGIINAGGFLVLRLADVIALSGPALGTLAIVGLVTAVFGSLVMLTQSSVKVSLACSTIAQMGFMMLQAGLGAWAAALLHIVAHSLYKAHAFLSSGSVIDLARASWSPSPGGQPHPARLGLALAAVLATVTLVGIPFGAHPLAKPGAWVLVAVMLMGVVVLVSNAIDERPNPYVLGRTVLLAALVAAGWFALHAGSERLFAGTLPATRPLQGAFAAVLVLAVIVGFGALTLFQGLLPRHAAEPRWQALYAHIANGFYVNTIANRWALRAWPAPAPRPGSGSAAPAWDARRIGA